MNNTALHVEITLNETLDERWACWFEGLDITPQPGGLTRLSGAVSDQAALHGVLERIRDLNLKFSTITVEEK